MLMYYDYSISYPVYVNKALSCFLHHLNFACPKTKVICIVL